MAVAAEEKAGGYSAAQARGIDHYGNIFEENQTNVLNAHILR